MVGARGKPYHFTALAYVIDGERVLLVKHRKLNLWLPPGGHMEADEKGMYIESPEECAVREVLEETGVSVEVIGTLPDRHDADVLPLRIPFGMHIHEIDAAHDHFSFDYLSRPKPGQSLKFNGDQPARWFTREDLQEWGGKTFEGALLREEIRDAALRALGQDFVAKRG